MTVLDAIYVCNVDTIIDTLKCVLANLYEIVKNLENMTIENTNMTPDNNYKKTRRPYSLHF